ncbi:DUF6354 family protein, partial [Streptomyces lavenduligriseus]
MSLRLSAGQLWRDMAPDMVARERILRVTDVTRRTCV